MTIEEAYIKFTIKLNKNLNSNNITADPARFVITFNENLSKRLVDVLSTPNDKRLREIQYFLVNKEILPTNTTTTTESYFELPKDYLDYSSGDLVVKAESCPATRMDPIEIKDANYSEIIRDNYLEPSYEYRETSFIIADNKLKVFKKDFEIQKFLLNYYRYPKKVDIAGYTKIDGSQSSSVDPEGDNKFLDKVISLTVEDFQRNYSDMQGVQISKDRIINNN